MFNRAALNQAELWKLAKSIVEHLSQIALISDEFYFTTEAFALEALRTPTGGLSVLN